MPRVLLALLVLAGAPGCAQEPPALEAIDFLPPDAVVVAELRPQSLLSSRLVRRELGRGEPARMLGEVTRTCGYDPLPRVERVTVAMVPQGVERGEFAAVVEGPLDARKLERCAAAIGERPGAATVRTTWSGAPVIRQREGPGAIALASARPVRIVLGEASLVRSMLRRAHVRGPSLRRAREVLDLRDLLGADRAIRIVARPTNAIRALARERLVPALRPLAGARAIGLGVSAGARLDVTVLARLESAAAAARLASTLEAAVARAHDEPLVELTAFGGPLRSLAIEPRDQDVVGVFSVTERHLEEIAANLEELEALAAEIGRR